MASSYAQRMALGNFGEDIAAAYLCNLGMVVLDRNYRCELGEIDIVVRDGPALVICEVKTRRSNRYGSPAEAVTPRKAARLRRLAGYWLEQHDVSPPSLRIDVVSVLVPYRGTPTVERIEGVA
ncbi:MAG: YraN family protein [Nocardioidaceae bacterium]|nr:YraN family protein [Nocardioidaceae bacterium]